MKTVLALLLTATVTFAGDGREDLVRKLSTKVSIDLRGARLADAIEMFRQQTGINYVIAEGADLRVHLTVRDLSARSALRLLLAPVELAAAFEDGSVVIRSRKSLAGAVTMKVYDVRAMMSKLKDFPGPRLGLTGPVIGSLGFG